MTELQPSFAGKGQTTKSLPGVFQCILLLVVLALMPTPTSGQATQYANVPPILLGAAWYPEQWPESEWDKDLDRMAACHIHLVRVGEFAWSTMEPEEGKYDFGWLDRAIEKAAQHHIVVVLGTPTAAPPAWLTSKYPQTLRVYEDGRRAEHGNRQQFSFTDPKYRELARGIAEQMATRYGHNPDVVGWQLDNEYAEPDFGPSAQAQFHAWLKRKYGTITRLNQLWTTTYWSQTYDNFDEIPVKANDENPALELDWKHFVSDTWKSYSQNQIDAIRPHADRRQFITTNTMGWFDGFDHYIVNSNLDIAAWDDYIREPVYDAPLNGATHDLNRGFKHKNFWVMETEPAFVDWRKTNNPLDKGQVREMAWQAVGHGADAVEYWQWRSALNGQEQYHGTLVGPDGLPVPVYAEIQQVGAEFEKAGPALSGTTPHSQAAIVENYDSRWAIDFQRHAADFDPVEELMSFYRPLRQMTQAVDLVAPDAPLDEYKLVEAPALNLLSEAVAQHLIDYVKQGGNLVLGPRSGMKDTYSALYTDRQPGPLAGLLGAHVEEFYALENPVPLSGDIGSGTSHVWAEFLTPSDPQTQVLLRYGTSNGWLNGQPAVVTRKAGKGSITYVGGWLDDGLMAKLTASWVQTSRVQPIVVNVPDGVEVCRRTGNGKSILILINHTSTSQSIALPSAMKDLLSSTETATSELTLPAHGVAVLQ
ncbi:MAG TPA: beta-galactosidase [Acidobacteriaceae bacterium]|nr:beta-galactosidase [Acidobacteriaceae bacterium]